MFWRHSTDGGSVGQRIRSASRSERGAGVFSMSFGLLMFLMILTFAVQILYNLYATTVVSNLAIEAARDVARLNGPTALVAEQEFNNRVGPSGSLTLTIQAEEVFADVQFVSNTVFPPIFDVQPFGVVDRTFMVRRELQQPVGP